MLSVDAFHETVTAELVTPLAARPVGVVGAWVSALHALVVTTATACGRYETFPAASYASSARLYSVPHVRPVNVYVRFGVFVTGMLSRYMW
jgi:hypothetical protein